ncbi:MAG: division/cell wall cluster transcriptional repressor MraZ [Lysobacteraceae bacterium]|jgi:MraZ protein|nr:division/cell wall cluster transcriptional repressor MraZ [Xanthomonadaceae bacterium]MCZ8318698.1 division/cell wall cluster transcriptional repressor MraZ [Silanimonas sp.]
MFQGETAITIDDKGRLAIPVAFRDVVARDCANRLVLTYNPFDQGSLYLYPDAGWQAVRDQVVALSPFVPEHRVLQRMLVGAATPLEPDSAGRVLLPATMRMAAGLEKRAVLMGMGGRLELWSEQAHLAQMRQTIGSAGVSAAMQDLRL